VIHKQSALPAPRILASIVFGICAAMAALALCNVSVAQSAWRDTPTTRLEALALMQTLSAELLASTSATLTLERWCQEHALAAPATIVAHRISGTEVAADDEQRRHLQVDATEPLRYRRVELRCGPHVLSIADNWYVPGRLTSGMNRLLDTSESPFGRVVLPLHPRRESLSALLLWSPLPQPGGRRVTKLLLDVPPALFEHRAIVYSGDNLPIAEVHEVYQRGLLEFPEPHLP
jgi:chorismate-pyruvate lyase